MYSKYSKINKPDRFYNKITHQLFHDLKMIANQNLLSNYNTIFENNLMINCVFTITPDNQASTRC